MRGGAIAVTIQEVKGNMPRVYRLGSGGNLQMARVYLLEI
jgi:hypothetical protein